MSQPRFKVFLYLQDEGEVEYVAEEDFEESDVEDMEVGVCTCI